MSMAPRARQLFSRIGAGCLLAIIPIKAIRVAGVTNSLAVGVAPSLLGPAGLLFFLCDPSGRLSKPQSVSADVPCRDTRGGSRSTSALPSSWRTQIRALHIRLFRYSR